MGTKPEGIVLLGMAHSTISLDALSLAVVHNDDPLAMPTAGPALNLCCVHAILLLAMHSPCWCTTKAVSCLPALPLQWHHCTENTMGVAVGAHAAPSLTHCLLPTDTFLCS